LLSRFPQYLMDLRFLFRVQLKRIKHPLEAILSRCFGAAPAPSLVTVQGKRTRSESEQEDNQRGDPNLPFTFLDNVHNSISPPILRPRISRSAADRPILDRLKSARATRID
jgi:hypothetical protein